MDVFRRSLHWAYVCHRLLHTQFYVLRSLFNIFTRPLPISQFRPRAHTANYERSEKRERKRGEEKTAHRAHTQCCGFILYNVYYATLYLPLSFTLFVVDMGFGYVYLLHVYTDVCLGWLYILLNPPNGRYTGRHINIQRSSMQQLYMLNPRELCVLYTQNALCATKHTNRLLQKSSVRFFHIHLLLGCWCFFRSTSLFSLPSIRVLPFAYFSFSYTFNVLSVHSFRFRL